MGSAHIRDRMGLKEGLSQVSTPFSPQESPLPFPLPLTDRAPVTITPVSA